MDEIRACRMKIIETHAFEQRQLLEQDRTLAPDSGLADGIATVVVCQRRFDMCLPVRHVASGQDAAMPLTADVHDFLGATEAIDGFGDKTLRPDFARALDLHDAIAAGTFSFLHNPPVRCRT